MPITQSAKQALRQNVRRRAQNVAKKNAMNRAVKDFKKFIAAKDMEKAKAQLATVYKMVDKTAKTNVIAKNKASRMKSRLSKLLK